MEGNESRQTVPATRTGTRKRRSGCKTCKTRHVRCDESRPVCLNCAKGRRICEWKPRPFANQYAGPRTCVTIRPRPLESAVSHQPSLSLLLSEEESRYLVLFRNVTADKRSGFFSSVFWTRIILQTSHLTPAVKYALIAIGALYKSAAVSSTLSFDVKKTSLTEADDHHNVALRQYHKAILLIRKSLDNGESISLRTALITCVLFTCFECFHGNQTGAIAQIHSGMKLLEDRQHRALLSEGRCNDGVEDDLIQLFRGISNNIKTYDLSFHCIDALPSVIFSTVDPVDAAHSLEIPDEFSTVEQAKFNWDQLKRSSMQFVLKNAIPMGGGAHLFVPPSSERDRFVVLQKRCYAAFQRLLDRTDNTSDFLAAQALNLDQKMTQILYPTTFETEHDTSNFSDEYAELLDLAQAVLDYQMANAKIETDGFVPAQASFSFDTLILYPLFFVATRCQVSELRHRAIDMLSSTNRREGLWDSNLVSKVATLILDNEEESRNVKGEIPHDARTILSSVIFEDMGRVAVVTCISKKGVTKTARFLL